MIFSLLALFSVEVPDDKKVLDDVLFRGRLMTFRDVEAQSLEGFVDFVIVLV